MQRLKARPGVYSYDLQAELKLDLGEGFCVMTICNAGAAGTIAKKRTLIVREMERADAVEKRELRRNSQQLINPNRAVFIDDI